MIPNLGQLQRINLREAWKNEATDFTPWLAQSENLNQLADALGLLDMELVQIEYQVGELDILCSDDDGEIIIENQLEKTNHTHLGQIVTYAEGIGAKKVVWLAESFRPEHIAALDFLNQNTTSELNYFAVQYEIGKVNSYFVLFFLIWFVIGSLSQIIRLNILIAPIYVSEVVWLLQEAFTKK